jgi:hypothetical protein
MLHIVIIVLLLARLDADRVHESSIVHDEAFYKQQAALDESALGVTSFNFNPSFARPEWITYILGGKSMSRKGPEEYHGSPTGFLDTYHKFSRCSMDLLGIKSPSQIPFTFFRIFRSNLCTLYCIYRIRSNRK